MLVMDETISELILSNAPGYIIRQTAVANGMVTMMDDGIAKVRSGETTFYELYQTLGTVNRMSK